MIYCFLDTNILLHFQTFDEVNWHQVLQREKVCLVITMQVVDDLDKFKNNSSNPKRQKRAGVINKKLDRFETEVEALVRDGVYLLIPKPISKAWLRANDFDVEDTDSIIIGEAKNFSEIRPDTEVICVSDDSGFRRRAALRGLDYRSPTVAFPHYSQHSNTITPTVRGPNIRKTNSYDVNFELKNLQHHFTYTWEPIYICFNEPVNPPTAFVVDCRILASNLPKPVEFKFRIHLN